MKEWQRQTLYCLAVLGLLAAVVYSTTHCKVVEIDVDGEREPVPVRLGVWVSNNRARRDKLTSEKLEALRKLGIDWA
ncbi:helicase associated domain-containing protein [Streptomyces sp. NPDC056488]|uniref:helicase associated domain-containing protein n=1 Tax=unclassified Streptomyces TaxID=2593676 RepID=UPI00344FE199